MAGVHEQSIEVTEDDRAQRFELRVGGVLAGHADYRTSPGRTVFVYTEIDPAFRGRGLGHVLATEAIARVRQRGDEVEATCWFMAAELHSG